MKVNLIICALFILLTGCKSLWNKDLVIKIENLPVDSCSIRINHIITGKEIYSNPKVALSDAIHVGEVVDDMYILVLSWPKTYIDHYIFKQRKKIGDDLENALFEVTKPILVDRKNNGSNLVLRVQNEVTLEELETRGSSILKYEHDACQSCNLVDQYWELYNNFFERKASKVDSLKRKFYQDVETGRILQNKDSYLDYKQLDSYFFNDEQLDSEIIELAKTHAQSPISTFFVFYQLFLNRNFDAYQLAFQNLQGEAQESKYYRMIANQYKDKASN